MSRAALLVSCALALAAPASAQQGPTSRAGRVARFLGGAALGLAAHEGGHLLCEYATGNRPDVHGVHFGPLPFFAIGPALPTTPRERALITSAGFWSQHASSEWMLTSRPSLRAESASVRKGYLAFNVLTSAAYAGAALARKGPLERDTRGIAESSGVSEPLIGLAVLVPAALDAYRFARPRSRWAPWASRAAKAAFVALVWKAPAHGPRR